MIEQRVSCFGRLGISAAEIRLATVRRLQLVMQIWRQHTPRICRGIDVGHRRFCREATLPGARQFSPNPVPVEMGHVRPPIMVEANLAHSARAVS
jgi:hypothetical protein